MKEFEAQRAKAEAAAATEAAAAERKVSEDFVKAERSVATAVANPFATKVTDVEKYGDSLLKQKKVRVNTGDGLKVASI